MAKCFRCKKGDADTSIDTLGPVRIPVHQACLNKMLADVAWRGGYGRHLTKHALDGAKAPRKSKRSAGSPRK